MAYKRTYCRRVIALGRKGYSLSAMASALGTARQALQGWARQYPEFKDALQLARDHAVAYWEGEAQKAIIRSTERVPRQDPSFNKRTRRKWRRRWRERAKSDYQVFIELQRRFPREYGGRNYREVTRASVPEDQVVRQLIDRTSSSTLLLQL